MKITKYHRERLQSFLKKFYAKYPNEVFSIFDAISAFKRRLKKEKKDAWIGVAGRTGEGKSLFCIMFMILFGRRMTLSKNIAYIPTGDQINEMFDALNFQCLLIDEAAREMRAVNWQSKAQQGVNVKAMTDRFKNNLVFLNMPSFDEFTKSMRKTNLQFRMIVLYRTDLYARVLVQRKSRNWRKADPWDDEAADKRYNMIEKKYREIDNDNILKIERSLPNYVMDFMVPNLELILPDICECYETNKVESRKKAIDVIPQTKKAERFKQQYEDLLNRVTKIIFNNELNLGVMKVTKGDMAIKLGVSITKFNKSLQDIPVELRKHINVRKDIKEEVKT